MSLIETRRQAITQETIESHSSCQQRESCLPWERRSRCAYGSALLCNCKSLPRFSVARREGRPRVPRRPWPGQRHRKRRRADALSDPAPQIPRKWVAFSIFSLDCLNRLFCFRDRRGLLETHQNLGVRPVGPARLFVILHVEARLG